MFFRIGPKLELILITINSIYCTVIVRDDLEEQKRREYETWFKNQEREQQLLEYDCSVQYVEKQPQQQQQREERYRQEVTSSTSTHMTTSDHQIKWRNNKFICFNLYVNYLFGYIHLLISFHWICL